MNNDDGWQKLNDTQKLFLFSGFLLRFKTKDTAGDDWKYALASRIDGAADISFVGFDGGSWGFGKAQLPVEARYEAKPYTVDLRWLANNLNYICNIEDENEVYFCEHFKPEPRMP